MIIRPAVPEDAQSIADIWNPVIRDSVATFTTFEKSVADLQKMILERRKFKYGFFVTELENRILGFATYGPFRNGPGYANTMEHSVFLSPDATGKGLGKALMAHLERHAKNTKVHSLIAGLSGENDGAIAFHSSLGYTKVADIQQAGFKFGRWHDLILMQKLL